jgi:hypothetical protein
MVDGMVGGAFGSVANKIVKESSCKAVYATA